MIVNSVARRSSVENPEKEEVESEGLAAMDTSFDGYVLDPSKCSKLSIEEKLELVYDNSKWAEDATELLQSWSRKELLEVISAAMGKERKYTSLTKRQLIEILFKVVVDKNCGTNCGDNGNLKALVALPAQTQAVCQVSTRKPRKNENPCRLVIDSQFYCKNLACRATLSEEDKFCKRCSCCICHTFDENKDPSLWLVCSSEPPDLAESCAMSCHIECALKNDKSNIGNIGQNETMDGRFSCVVCGKTNDLISYWRKQLIVAKDARRVDALCYRLSLSQKLLLGTTTYQNLCTIVDLALKTLEEEVGPFDVLLHGSIRSIVGRLACASTVQRLCASAVVALDNMHLHVSQIPTKSDPHVKAAMFMPLRMVRFVENSPTSLTLSLDSGEATSCVLWHRKSDVDSYSTKPTCILHKASSGYILSDLCPATEYTFRFIPFRDAKELGRYEIKYMKTHSAHDSGGDQQMESQKTDSDTMDTEDCSDKNADSVTRELMSTKFQPNTRHDTLSKSRSDHEERQLSTALILQELCNGNRSTIRNCSAETKFRSDVNNTALTENGVSQTEEPSAPFPSTPVILEGCNGTPAKKARISNGNNGCSEAGSLSPTIDLPHQEQQCGGSSTKKRRSGRVHDYSMHPGLPKGPVATLLEKDHEYCIKMIRRLECEGHLQRSFRTKFLTWFSLRASSEERRIVGVFVDTLSDDLAGLAGQLIDTFSERIWCKKQEIITAEVISGKLVK